LIIIFLFPGVLPTQPAFLLLELLLNKHFP
jgi:hypothetical protein